MKHLTPEELTSNVFQSIGKDWMLVSACDPHHPDKTMGTLTASWGGMGVLWNKNVFFCFIRPQRYTKEFIDAQNQITLSFFDPARYREALKLCGRLSGRDCDKFAEANLTPYVENSAVFFKEASLTVVGRKLFAQPLEEASFLDASLVPLHYPAKDFHTMYVCEITDIVTP